MARRFVLALAGAAGLVLLFAAPASAHAVLVGADPAPGSVQVQQPSTVVLHFNEHVDRASSEVWVADRDGRHRTALILGSTAAGTLQADLRPLGPGVYRLGFDVQGADGHRSGGEYRFAVWPAGTPAPVGLEGLAVTTLTDLNRPLAATRGLALAGSLPLAGLVLVRVLLRRRAPPRWFHPVVSVVGILVFVADLAVLAWQGTPLEAVHTRFGGLVVLHAAAVALLVVVARWPTSRLAAGVAGAMLVPLVLTGHPYALAAQPVAGAAVDWGHLASAAAWVGILAWLLLRVCERDPGALTADARSLSRWAPAAAATVVVTGTFNAWRSIPAWHFLAGSGYGSVLILKVGLVALALALAMAARAGRWRAIPGEAGVMIGVLAAAATLAAITPPIEAHQRPAGPVLASAVLGDQMFAVLVTPGTPGPNTVRVTPVRTTDGSDTVAPTLQLVTGGAASVDVALTPASPGWTASLDLPESAARIRLTVGAIAQEVFVPASRTASKLRVETTAALGGPYGGECRDRLIGQIAAVNDFNTARHAGAALVASDAGAPCEPTPTTGDAEAVGRIFGRFLSDNRVNSAALVGDGSARASAFQAGIEATGTRISMQQFAPSELDRARAWAPEAVVMAGGRDAGAEVVAATADGEWLPTRGVYFAPWLLDAALLTSAVEGRGAQVTIGLDVDPYDGSAQRYLAVLRRQFPFETPTGAGLDGYVQAARLIEAKSEGKPVQAVSQPRTLRFFAAAQVAFLPSVLHDDHEDHAWLSAGGLAEVSGPVSDPQG